MLINNYCYRPPFTKSRARTFGDHNYQVSQVCPFSEMCLHLHLVAALNNSVVIPGSCLAINSVFQDDVIRKSENQSICSFSGVQKEERMEIGRKGGREER